jgi:transposase-like protein
MRRASPNFAVAKNLYYRWSKEFLEAGKTRFAGDTVRAATSDEVKDLRREASALKEVVAELTLENRLLKKSVAADGEDAERDIPPPTPPALRTVPLASARSRLTSTTDAQAELHRGARRGISARRK